MAFVHLHVHSQYSILDGTMDPTQIAKAAIKQGMPAVAMTDSGNLFGAVAFYKECKGVKPIIGAELHIAPTDVSEIDRDREACGYQIIALVENEIGYQNLCVLITRSIVEGLNYKPQVSLSWIEEYQEGLIFLTGGKKGVFGRPLLRGDAAKAESQTKNLSEILHPDRLYFELIDHGVEGDDQVNICARRFSQQFERPLVVTNGVHYENPEDSVIHEVLHGIAFGASLGDARHLSAPTDQAYFKTEEEIRFLFPDDIEAIERTAILAERCHFKFKFDTFHFPAATPPDPDIEGVSPDTDANWEFFYRAFPPPRDFKLPEPHEAIPLRPSGAGNLNGYFEWYSQRGLELRLSTISLEKHLIYQDRLEFELKMIERMGFPAYLLIVAEFINWSKDNGIPVGPGRGSAAGSLVAFAMRITDIDPIQFELLFERFLNPERVSMPDIDVDFCQDRREEAIQHVRAKYGEELVSQIITYGKLKAKAAVRDVARAFDWGPRDINSLGKEVPEELGITLKDAIQQTESLRLRRQLDPRGSRVLRVAQAVEGMCRQTGVHAAGVVIADQALVKYAPLFVDEPGATPAVQYDMKSAEMIGLIKFDFLGLKTLDQIRDTVIAIRENHQIDIDMSKLPVDDESTYALLQRGDALGVFQLESSGMRDLLTRLKPSCLDDLVALVALYRPGPLESGMVADFVDRKHGRKKVEYPHPLLEPILRSTYGTIVYQEQVMQCAQHMAGYSLGEADLLRRAMGKKQLDEMAKQKNRFVSGSVANGVPEERAAAIFDLLEKFAAYGFNKSHSAAYGYISYQTAWLKANYRQEYMSALMTMDAGDTDKILGYIDDCRRAGIRIEAPCINQAVREFRAASPHIDSQSPVQSSVIRMGLAAVKGVGDGAIAAILDTRAALGGRFRDASEFFERVDFRKVTKKVVELLILAGAFDGFGLPRAAYLYKDESGTEAFLHAIAFGARRQQEAASGQVSLFSNPSGSQAKFRFVEIPELPLVQRLIGERRVLGLYLSGHPIEILEKDIKRYATHRIADLASVLPDQEIRLIAIPVAVRVITTGRGDTMGFVKLEDATGSIEAVFFSEPWARSHRAVHPNRTTEEIENNLPEPVLVSGRVELREGEIKLRATTAESITDVRSRSIKEVCFKLSIAELDGQRLEKFHAILENHRGASRMRLLLRHPQQFEAELEFGDRTVEPSLELEQSICALFGRSDVVVMT